MSYVIVCMKMSFWQLAFRNDFGHHCRIDVHENEHFALFFEQLKKTDCDDEKKKYEKTTMLRFKKIETMITRTSILVVSEKKKSSFAQWCSFYNRSTATKKRLTLCHTTCPTTWEAIDQAPCIKKKHVFFNGSETMTKDHWKYFRKWHVVFLLKLRHCWSSCWFCFLHGARFPFECSSDVYSVERSKILSLSSIHIEKHIVLFWARDHEHFWSALSNTIWSKTESISDTEIRRFEKGYNDGNRDTVVRPSVTILLSETRTSWSLLQERVWYYEIPTSQIELSSFVDKKKDLDNALPRYSLKSLRHQMIDVIIAPLDIVRYKIIFSSWDMKYINCRTDHLDIDRSKPNISLRIVNENDKEFWQKMMRMNKEITFSHESNSMAICETFRPMIQTDTRNIFFFWHILLDALLRPCADRQKDQAYRQDIALSKLSTRQRLRIECTRLAEYVKHRLQQHKFRLTLVGMQMDVWRVTLLQKIANGHPRFDDRRQSIDDVTEYDSVMENHRPSRARQTRSRLISKKTRISHKYC